MRAGLSLPGCRAGARAAAGYASRARRIQNQLKLNTRYTPEDEIAFLRAQLAEKAATIAALEAQARARPAARPRSACSAGQHPLLRSSARAGGSLSSGPVSAT